MNSEEKILLTRFSKGSGCGCKIAPAILEQVLKGSQAFADDKLLVGFETRDDAAVYDIENGNLLISTTDFFTPIVNDAYDFGRIAAANAISDVYAMGGKPLMALAVLGWPVEKLPVSLAAQVLQGARATCTEAGILLAGGHSIDIQEPVFGLCVTGMVNQNQLKRNNTAGPGDSLFLTKPLGSGVLAAALKRDQLQVPHQQELIAHLSALNSIGARLGEINAVTAMTDITGFGLLGHLTEMTASKKVTAHIDKSAIPRMNGFDEYTSQLIYPENTTRNFTAYSALSSGMTDLDFLLYCDPQTNGGLLFTVKPEGVNEVKAFLEKSQQQYWIIGKMAEYNSVAVTFI